MSLTPELTRMRDEIRKVVTSYGLDTFDVIFEMIDAKQINEIAAYGGFPVRYPHWKWGMSYERLSKGYEWGLSKIYEMVINTDPCYAYLMRANNHVDQKTVISHVYAHCDFFKNNYYFSKTNRKMLDQMANHSTKIHRLIDKYGESEVEAVIDTCLSVENLIDIQAPYRVSPRSGEKEDTLKEAVSGKLKSKGYMDKFINPPEFLNEMSVNEEQAKHAVKFPEKPERDILNFVLEHSRLEGWKKEVLSIIREEAYYFAPQGMTKIMNEGWATYWHSKIMTGHILNDSEIIDFADAHSGVLATAPGQINPYKIGVELYKYIEERWDKGRFGIDYLNCDDYLTKMNWDTKAGQGQEKIFQVRSFYNDITFIDEFVDEEFARRQQLYEFGQDPRTGNYVILSRDYKKIKNQLLDQLTNFGNPIIEIIDGNYKNRSQLLLTHQFLGAEIQLNYAHQVLRNLEILWTRPVAIETTIGGARTIFACENGVITEEKIGPAV